MRIVEVNGNKGGAQALLGMLRQPGSLRITLRQPAEDCGIEVVIDRMQSESLGLDAVCKSTATPGMRSLVEHLQDDQALPTSGNTKFRGQAGRYEVNIIDNQLFATKLYGGSYRHGIAFDDGHHRHEVAFHDRNQCHDMRPHDVNIKRRQGNYYVNVGLC